ncbi:MAG: sulfotransferase domain-containing protein [Gemmatimonadota bacterium]|nr:sulfotransferase domain-containing protein [Gemmatimonadota bacterium]MYC70651.1 sulfotransferase [Gemmatimonadota bacterium]MYI61902.1 sulfotransferase [Gemmatimonadota bacterium]
MSGLPRSGTSMLMKMLAAGGLPPLTDGIREADADNPGGYYEFEKVKQLERDTAWLESARGKAVKVISQLLDQLPPNRPYKIVFALRKMDEILASQRAMLARRGQPCDRISDAEMATAFGRHLSAVQQWLSEHPQMKVLYVDYAAVLRDPLATSHEIKTFLALPLDVRQMASVVDQSLYRQRIV